MALLTSIVPPSNLAIGAASSTDNAVVRFDGTTGKLIQNSNVTIDDDGTTVISTNSSSTALRITQTGAGNALVVEDSANPDSSPFTINSEGNLGIGGTVIAGTKISLRGTITASGGNSFVTYDATNIDPSVTTGGYYGHYSIPLVSAGSLGVLSHFTAAQPVLTGSVTSQFGFFADATLAGATNNYGFYSNIPSGTGEWNFYAAGTAPNYFAGDVTVNSNLTVGSTNVITELNTKTSTGKAIAMAIVFG